MKPWSSFQDASRAIRGDMGDLDEVSVEYTEM